MPQWTPPSARMSRLNRSSRIQARLNASKTISPQEKCSVRRPMSRLPSSSARYMKSPSPMTSPGPSAGTVASHSRPVTEAPIVSAAGWGRQTRLRLSMTSG